MKLQLFTAFFSLAVSGGAFAGQRYLVVLKSSDSYRTAQTTLSHSNDFLFQGLNLENKNSFSSVNAKVEASLDHLNALVVRADSSEMAKLEHSPEVAIVEKEVMHPLPKPEKGYVVMKRRKNPAQPDNPQDPQEPSQPPYNPPTPTHGVFSVGAKTPWGILAVKAPDAWGLSNQGQGARVMVLDTGLDVNHPSIHNNFEKGQDFANVDDSGNVKDPNDITDTVGHGTHVSGTIAGVQDSTGFTGVAPSAKILMGRVCSTEGCSNIAVAQGIEWGIQEKVDVISMSLGGSMSTPAERDAVAKAEQSGVSVVAAAGNDGTAQVGYPAALPTVVAVGAVDSDLKKADFSQYGPELAVVAPGVNVLSSVPRGTGRDSQVKITINGNTQIVSSTTFEGAKDVDTEITQDIVDAGFGAPDDFSKISAAGKFVLVARGNITIHDKIQNAISANAAGLILYNNAPGLIRGALTEDGTTLPMAVMMIEQTVGQNVKQQLSTGTKVSGSIVVLHTDYASFDGTSMATPHVAGVVALIRAMNKRLAPADVKDLLKKTAHALSPNDQNQYGAGVVDAAAAVKAAAGQ